MTETIKQIIRDFLNHMGFAADVAERMEEGHTVFNVKTQDAQLLIGKQGANLEALQYLVRLLIRRHPELERVPFTMDIDDYRDQRTIHLKDLARKAANQVRSTGRGVALPVMPAYERRVVHNYLSLFSDIGSYSTGQDPSRRIVLKPKPRGPSPRSEEEFHFIENS